MKTTSWRLCGMDTPLMLAPRPGLEQIWLNGGGGDFHNGTAQIIDGPVPLTRGGVNTILIRDFNEDGRPDVFTIDSGIDSAAAFHYPIEIQGFHQTLREDKHPSHGMFPCYQKAR